MQISIYRDGQLEATRQVLITYDAMDLPGRVCIGDGQSTVTA